MPRGNEPKRVRLYFMGFSFRKCRPLLLFANAGTQTKPICFSSKGRSGVRGKADIERCFIVGRGNMGVLLRPKRHAGVPLEQFSVTHVRPSLAPAESNKWNRPGLLSREDEGADRELASATRGIAD
jgi:hypothetical protein